MTFTTVPFATAVAEPLRGDGELDGRGHRCLLPEGLRGGLRWGVLELLAGGVDVVAGTKRGLGTGAADRRKGRRGEATAAATASIRCNCE